MGGPENRYRRESELLYRHGAEYARVHEPRSCGEQKNFVFTDLDLFQRRRKTLVKWSDIVSTNVPIIPKNGDRPAVEADGVTRHSGENSRDGPAWSRLLDPDAPARRDKSLYSLENKRVRRRMVSGEDDRLALRYLPETTCKQQVPPLYQRRNPIALDGYDRRARHPHDGSRHGNEKNNRQNTPLAIARARHGYRIEPIRESGQ